MKKMSAVRVMAMVFVCMMIAAAAVAGQSPLDGKVNLNSATAKELSSIPGIGKKKAEAIITYRSETGDFASVDDLIKVDGIGRKTLEKIKPYITVQGS